MTGPAALIGSIIRSRRTSPVSAMDLCAVLIDAMPPGAGVVAVVQPGSCLDQGLIAAIPADRLYQHLPIADSANTAFHAALIRNGAAAESPIVILQDRDRDVPRPANRPWPQRAASHASRLRRADTLYQDHHRIGLLVIEDGRDATAILRGAAGLLRSHNPGIVIDLGLIAPADRPAAAETCAGAAGDAGYGWYDSVLLPCGDAAERRATLLLEAERYLLGLPHGHALVPTPPSGIAGLLSPDEAPLAAFAWNGWRDPIPVAARTASPISAAFNTALPCSGFHPPETDGLGTWWRWSGPECRCGFAMPAPAAGRWTLRLDVLSWGVANGPDALRVLVDGRPMTARPAANDAARFGDIVIAPQGGGRLRVEIVTPTPQRASPSDLRRIGTSFMRCVLEPVP